MYDIKRKNGWEVMSQVTINVDFTHTLPFCSQDTFVGPGGSAQRT